MKLYKYVSESRYEPVIEIPDNPTNGEVIKKMFPHYDIEIDEHKGYVRVFYENFYTTYPLAWWNRKWGE